MNLEELQNQFQGRKFGELVLHHIKKQSQNNLLLAIQGTVSLLPESFQKNEIALMIDDLNKKIYEQTFWQNDCAATFSSIIENAKQRFTQKRMNPSEEDLFNVFNIIVLNFAYSASMQREMKKYIKRSVRSNFFKRFSRKKDISELYRWSIIFKKNGIPHYEMLGDNVIRMLGYYMLAFGENGNPTTPWELYLKFNKNGKDIQLTKLYFPSRDTILEELYLRIETIDPEFEVISFKEEIFITRLTGESIQIKSTYDYHQDMLADIESLKNGTFEERQRQKESEITFFKVLNGIFN